MKLINNRWVDENNNSWDANINTEESAQKKSNTMKNCSDCSECSYFKTNPQRMTSSKIGSRNSQTTYYWTNEHEQIICGCFKGTLDEFEQRVKKIHGDNEHGIAYQKWIDKIKIYKN